jgi:K+ transporter
MTIAQTTIDKQFCLVCLKFGYFSQKVKKNLHMSKKSCTFATQNKSFAVFSPR